MPTSERVTEVVADTNTLRLSPAPGAVTPTVFTFARVAAGLNPVYDTPCPGLSCPADTGTCYSGQVTLRASAIANTPVGFGVEVDGLVCGQVPLSISFTEVSSAGATTATCDSWLGTTVQPSFLVRTSVGFGYTVGISTDAEYSGPIHTCFTFPEAYSPAAREVVAHWNSTTRRWDSLPYTWDAVSRQACVWTNSFSPFVIGEAALVGLVPSTDDAAKCAKVGIKTAVKFHRAISKCHAVAAKAAVGGGSFDEAACETAARAKHDKAVTRLTTCSTCQQAAVATLGDVVLAQGDTLTAAPYCDGTLPLEDTELGYLPPDAAAGVCANKMAVASDKFMKKLLACRSKTAKAVLKGASYDRVACEGKVFASFEKTESKLGSCAPCIGDMAGELRDQAAAYASTMFRDLYCEGVVEVP